MTEHRRYYRLRVWDGTGDLADFLSPSVAANNLLNISSVPSGDAPYIAGPPSGGGREIDPVTGESTIGTMTVPVIDAVTDASSALLGEDGFESYPTGAGGHSPPWSDPPTVVGDSPATLSFGVNAVSGDGGAFSGGAVAEGRKSLRLIFSHYGAFEGPITNGSAYTERTFGGMEPNTEVFVRLRVGVGFRTNYRTPTNQNQSVVPVGMQLQDDEPITAEALGEWVTLSGTATTDSSGDLRIRLGFFGYNVVIAGTNTQRFAYIDALYIYATPYVGEGRVVTKNLADTAARWHLLSRRAVVEQSEDASSWTTLHSGYLNRYGLQGGLSWEFTVGDSERAENQVELFRESGPPANSDGVMSSPSMILGGPITSGLVARGDTPLVVFGGGPDYGPVRFEVISLAGVPARQVSMTFKSGYLRPYYDGPASGILRDEERAINNYVRRHFTHDPVTFESDSGQTRSSKGYHGGLVVRLTRVSDGAVFYRTPIAAPSIHRFQGNVIPWQKHIDGLVDATGRLRVDWPDPSGGGVTDIMGRPLDSTDDARPTVGTEFDVEVWATEVSESSRWHEKGRPLDLLTKHLAEAGETWDQTSADAVTDAIDTAFGGEVVAELIHEKPITLRQYKNMLFANFRFSERRNAAGELEFFSIANSPPQPGLTIGVNDLRAPGTPHEADEQSIVTRVEVECLSMQPVRPDGLLDDYSTEYNADGLATARFTVEGAADTLVASSPRTHKIALPGRILVDGKPFTGDDFVAYAQSLGTYLVDWLAGGLPTAELPCLPRITAREGDEITVDVPHLPVPVVGATPVTQRGQAPRTMRVVRREETPAGPNLTLVDAPPGALAPVDPPAGDPVVDPPEVGDEGYDVTFSLALSATDPARVATATISATVEIDGEPTYARFQYTVAASEPTTPGVTVPQVVENAENETLDLPPVVPGAKLWARARAEEADGTPLGAWSAWQSIELSASGGLTVPPPALSYVIAEDGDVTVSAVLTAPAAAVRIVAGTVNGAAPTEAEVLLGTLLDTPPFESVDIVTLDTGETVTISAIAEDADGATSSVASVTVQRAAIGGADTNGETTRRIALSFSWPGDATSGDHEGIQAVHVPAECVPVGWKAESVAADGTLEDADAVWSVEVRPAAGGSLTDLVGGGTAPELSSESQASGDSADWDGLASIEANATVVVRPVSHSPGDGVLTTLTLFFDVPTAYAISFQWYGDATEGDTEGIQMLHVPAELVPHGWKIEGMTEGGALTNITAAFDVFARPETGGSLVDLVDNGTGPTITAAGQADGDASDWDGGNVEAGGTLVVKPTSHTPGSAVLTVLTLFFGRV